MLDVAVAYNRYKFLGNEFLTWLWYVIDNRIPVGGRDGALPGSVQIGNRIVLENNRNESVEHITIKGDDAGLEEGILALRKGAVVTELNLTYAVAANKWQFSIKGESLSISGLKTPETGSIESEDDTEGGILEKVYLVETVVSLLDALFSIFIKLRIAQDWEQNVVPQIRDWLKQ